MKKARCVFGAFCIKGEIYVFGGIDSKKVEKYSPDMNTWEYVTDMVDDRRFFSSLSFEDKVYIMGGLFDSARLGLNTSTCFQFDTKSLDRKEILSK